MKEIKIYQSPVDYQLIYQTPEGVMNEKEYLEIGRAHV